MLNTLRNISETMSQSHQVATVHSPNVQTNAGQLPALHAHERLRLCQAESRSAEVNKMRDICLPDEDMMKLKETKRIGDEPGRKLKKFMMK